MTDQVVRSTNAGRFLGTRAERTPQTYREFLALVHPDDRDRVQRALERAIHEGATYYEEFRILKPDGRVMWVADKGVVNKYSAGAPVRMSGVLINISERKQTDEHIQNLNKALLERAEELQAIIDALPVGVLVANDRACASVRANMASTELMDIAPGANASKSPPFGHKAPFRLMRDGVDIPPTSCRSRGPCKPG